jgi:DNA-directed RNA polymerase specialized sigma24 family protein
MSEQSNGEDPRVRAEQLVDRITGDVTSFASRMVARAWEEAEDLWAEARSVRHGTPPAPPRE